MILLDSLQEQTDDKAARFVQSFSRSRADLQKLSNRGARNIVRQLRDLRGEIKQRLVSASGDVLVPFTTSQIPSIQASINDAISQFSGSASSELISQFDEAFNLGSTVTASGLRSVGIPLSNPGVSRQVLTTVSNISGTLVQDVSSQMGARINAAIARSTFGLEPAGNTIRLIDNMLSTQTRVRREGLRRTGFGFRAETIARTEINRVYTSSQQGASQILSNSIPGLRKSWLTATDGRVRKGHKQTENRYRPGGSIGPIPINDRFEVKVFSRVGRSEFFTFGGRRVRVSKPALRRGRVITDHLLHPVDPAGSPGAVINCRCTVMDVVPDFEQSVERALGVIKV